MKTFLKTILLATTPAIAATPPAATEPATAPATTSQPSADAPATGVAYANPPLIIPDDTPIQNQDSNIHLVKGLRL